MSLSEAHSLLLFEESGVILTEKWWNECLEPLN